MPTGGSSHLKFILEKPEHLKGKRWWWLHWLCVVVLSDGGYGGLAIIRSQIGTPLSLISYGASNLNGNISYLC